MYTDVANEGAICRFEAVEGARRNPKRLLQGHLQKGGHRLRTISTVARSFQDKT